MAASSAAKPVAVFALLLGVWVVTYWLYEPGPPPITFADAPPAAQLAQPRTAVPAPPPEPEPALPLVVVPPKPVEVTGVVPPKFTTYTVQRGDTSLEVIARKLLGHARYAEAISRSNPLVPPTKLIPGRTVLKIPVDPENIQGRVVTVKTTDDQVPEGLRDSARPVPTPGPGSSWPMQESVHTVKSGETLSSIAKQYYSAPNGYLKLYEANKDKLRSPDELKVGMQLRVPPGP